MKNKIITLIVLIFLSLIIVGCTNKSEPVKEEKKENEGWIHILGLRHLWEP